MCDHILEGENKFHPFNKSLSIASEIDSPHKSTVKYTCKYMYMVSTKEYFRKILNGRKNLKVISKRDGKKETVYGSRLLVAVFPHENFHFLQAHRNFYEARYGIVNEEARLGCETYSRLSNM